MMLHLLKWRWRWRCRLLQAFLVAFLSGCFAVSPASFRFLQPAYNVSIPESPDGKAYAVPHISADRLGVPVSDPASEVRYRILSGDHRKIFRPTPRLVGDFAFLNLRTKTNAGNRLNRELDSSYDLVVEATVKGHQELIATATVHVDVLDRNDLKPLFYPTRYSVEIDEDVAVHAPILTVTATDADIGLNGDIYYTLQGKSEYFSIHPKNGMISAIKRPNVDVQKDFELTVIAQDRGVRTKKGYFDNKDTQLSTAQVSILVRRVNRNSPFISVQSSSLPSLFSESHPDVLATVQVTDADAGIHGQIASVDVTEEPDDRRNKSGLFFFVTETGTAGQYYIRTPENSRGDWENVKLNVKATDRGIPSKSSSKIVTVSLVPANEHAPKFAADKLTLDASEGLLVHSLVAQVRAEDGDAGRNGQLEYSLMTESDTFRINNATGWISLLRPLDRETRDAYELQVSATDSAPEGLRKSATTRVTIRVTDENDNDPFFEQPSEVVVVVSSMAENAPAGYIVYTAQARDRDDADNGLISYSLANLNEIPFQVDPSTGRITLIRTLDHELDRREYNLRVRARDAGRPFRRESEQRLLIKLQPKNDNAPALRKWDCRGNAVMPRGEGRNATLMTLSAVDPDEGDAITYKLLNEEESIKKCFFVDHSTGDVIVRCGSRGELMRLLDADGMLRLKLVATDGTFDSAPCWLNITLSESDEKAINVGQSSSSSSANGDLNRSSNTAIECRNNPQVDIYAEWLERSRQTNAQLDTFPPATPDVVGMNRWTPKFPTDFPAIVHVDEDVRVGDEVLGLTSALDEDYRYNALLRYSAISDGDYFRVSPEGKLVVARGLDRETRLIHSVNVTVEDSGSPSKSSSRLVLVKVLDKNDNSPVFTTKGCVFTIPENSPTGTPIGTITATDADEGLNGQVIYSLPTPNRLPFSINPETGLLTVTGQIDYEQTPQHRFPVEASDNAADSSTRSSRLDCVVVVLDVNDNPPRFPSSLIKLSVPEDILPGSIVAFAEATDVDTGAGGDVHYMLVGTGGPLSNIGDDDSDNHVSVERKNNAKSDKGKSRSQIFAVDGQSGALSVVGPLDFEAAGGSFFNVSIVAMDRGQPSLSATLSVEVHVEDVDENLNAPKFKDFVTSASVLENQPADTFVTQVKAVDEDGDGVVYSLVGGSGLHLFRMDNEGTIRTGVTFDRETQEHYWLKILARDTAAVPKYSVLFVYVKIGDVNDNCPMTVEPIYYTSVPENSPPDTVVARLAAFDLDSSSSFQPSYRITAGNPQGFFVINEKTGLIRTTSRKFDRETQPEHTLEITISDNGEPSALTSTTHVVVAVQDVQDSAVAFLKEHTQRYQVPAWKTPGSLPLLRIVAFDTDVGTNAEIRFALAGRKTENDRYKIDSSTGEIFALQPLKIGEDYEVVIKASDPEDSTLKKTLRIVIEASPIPLATTKPPRIQSSFNAQVLESDAVGHMVILLEAEDPDGDFLWYYIVGGDPDKQFHIGPNSGSLIVARPLDWETRRNYTLLVNVTDGVHFVPTTVHVRVGDVNEHRPQFLRRTFTASVSENAAAGTEVVRVTASDFDEEQRLLYSIYSAGSPSSQTKFHIDETSGVITTLESLDRETTAQHTLIIVVKDRGTASRGDLAKVLINVIDLNDHAPAFRERPAVVIIPSDAPVGTVVTTVEASDQDSGLNGEISYLSYDSQSLFDIDPVTGAVNLLQTAEKMGSDEVAVKVVAVDRGVPPLKTETVILFRAETVKLKAFAFHESNVTASVSENLPTGVFVAVMTLDVQSFVSYQLSDNGDGAKNAFAISSLTGVVTTAAVLDYEKTRKYGLTITATNDAGDVAQATLTVLVLDMNDNLPKLNFTSIVGSISETSPPGSMVLDISGRPLILTAWDMDDGPNKRLTFSILESEAQTHFEILSTGSVRLRKPVDFEKQQQYQFHVQVTDSGRPQLTSAESAKVTIDVVNVNDCAPLFSVKEYNFTVTTPAFSAFQVGTVMAIDPDTVDGNANLSYKLSSGNVDKMFSINATTGVLALAKAVFINESGIRSIVVQAFDGIFFSNVRIFVAFAPLEQTGIRFREPQYHFAVQENDHSKKELAVLSLVGLYLNEDFRFQLLTLHPAFSLNSVTGSLRTTGIALDREEVASLTLTVEAVSEGGHSGRGAARAEILINVTDVNDNTPRFSQTVYRLAVPVSTAPDTTLLVVNATDQDEGNNSALIYSIVSDSSEFFALDAQTGRLVLAKPLLREVMGRKLISLKIRVTDQGMPSLSSEAVVEIRIVSNAVPVFTDAEYRVQISETLEIGSPIITVQTKYSTGNGSAADRKTVYAIVSGDPFYNFDIDFLTGAIRLSQPVDFEVQKQYILRVRGMDPSNWESLYSEVDVVVDVLDANNNAPKAKDGASFHIIRISESTVIGTEIFHAEFTDSDSGLNGALHYTVQWSEDAAREANARIRTRKSEEDIYFRCGIQKGAWNNDDFKAAEYFHIDPTSGRISLINNLDREVIDQLDLTIIVSDLGHPRQTSVMTLRIIVKDTNDNAPCFVQSSYDFVITDEIRAGKFVGGVASVDRDEDASIRYEIISGNDAELFVIDNDGIIRFSNLAKGYLQSTTQLTITATDGVHVSQTDVVILPSMFNREAPKFDYPVYTLTAAENAVSGSFIGSVHATDRDSGRNGMIRYSIVGDFYDDLFAIDAEKGDLTVVGVLDREQTAFYRLWIQAVDTGGLRDFCQVYLTITDVNDEAPVFLRSFYTVTVMPNTTLETPLLKVEASDNDLHENGAVVYTLKKLGGGTSNWFQIDPNSGVVKQKKQLKITDNKGIRFTVEATDRGTPPLTTSVPVEILFVDGAHNLPEFSQHVYHVSIHEDAPVNTTVLHTRLRTTGDQPQPFVTYSLIHPANLTTATVPFAINADGKVVVSTVLDAERQTEYTLTVAAVLKSASSYIGHAEVRIKIIDENDNAPVFLAKKFIVQTPENTTGIVRLLPMEAVDPDHGTNGEVRYELMGASVDTPFMVDSKTGWLSLRRRLDKEAQGEFALVIKATDSGSPPLSSTASVDIEVLDINDNAPYFAQSQYEVSVKEEHIPETPIIILHAADSDQTSVLEYFITNGDPFHHFMINSRGEVFIVAPLDRETKDLYELTVVASDGQSTTTTHLKVTVLDINDNAPFCNKSSFREIVPEDIDIGHIVLRVLAVDADQQNQLDYSLVGEGSDSFVMDRATGILRVKTNLDREAQDRFTLLGIAADRDGKSCTASIEVIVTDVNDVPPTFPENLTLVLPEDTEPNTLIYRLRSRDDDLGANRVVKYSLLPSDQTNPESAKLFSVGSENGLVRMVGVVDREKTSKYDLRIRAKDSGTPSLWSMARLLVSIQNVRDDPPVFTKTEYHFHVPENLVIGAGIGKVDATSLDDAVQEDISYQITDGNQLGHFYMVSRSGNILLNKTLDFEKQPEYVIVVEARESSDPPLVGSSRVLVHVTDVNDNAPVWASDAYEAKISESIQVGSQVLQVSASDSDTGINGKIVFELVNQTLPFAVDRTTGWITVSGTLDRETVPVYSVAVKAIDQGLPPMSAVKTVEVSLLDVNDNAPVFSKANYSVVLQEKRPVGFTVLRFALSDADTEPNAGPFAIAIVSGNDEGFFEVRSEDTSLRTTRSLEDRLNSEFRLVVLAKDKGEPALSTNTTVVVRVVEESQFPPKINPLHIAIQSGGRAFAGGVIGRITATDADIYDSLRYELVSLDSKSLFDLNALQGSLSAKPGLLPGQYELNVSVTDGRFTTFEKVSVSIVEISEEVLENSIGIELQDVSVEEFVNNYKRDFTRAVRQIFSLRRNKDIHLVSVQPGASDSDNELDDRRKRDTGDYNNSLEVLFAVAKGKNGGGFHSADHVRTVLAANLATFDSITHLEGTRVIPRSCQPESCAFGECQNELKLLDASEEPYVSVIGNNGQSYVYPRHHHGHRCICKPGYGGIRCEKLINDCASRQCEAPKVCSANGVTGESKCLCPDGRDLLRCSQEPRSDTEDVDALSFNGQSFAWFDLQKPIERHLSLTMKFKTRYGAGNLMYVAGRLDYSILEIKHGVVQYRFDCGSGEGLARLEGLFVSDNQWHELSVQRHGRHVEIRIDGKYAAQATAPGINDILNLEGNDAFFGAEVPGRSSRPRSPAPITTEDSSSSTTTDVRRGFSGCMKHIQLNGHDLPRTGRNSEATLLQHHQIQFGCHISSAELGPCASLPCQNGGTCEATPSKSAEVFVCRCSARYSGTFCENDSNPCAGNPCLSGSCTNRLPNDFHCACPSGLTGKRCEYGRYCNPNPCQNGGCEEGTFGPICQCFQGFEGSRCERDVDECLQAPCQNGGVCQNLLGGFRCNCSSVQTRGTLCDDVIFIPNMSGMTNSWGWIEIFVIVSIIIVVMCLAILGVLCRRKFRKRRTVQQHQLVHDSSTGSPSSQGNLNNSNMKTYDELTRNKIREKTRIGPEDLLKRGSKISNLEVEARQPFLSGSEQGTSSIRAGYGKSRFRNPPLTPPPPSLSGASSETVSVRKSTVDLHQSGGNDPDVVKACVVDLPARSASSSEYRRRRPRDNSGDTQGLTTHPDGSIQASVSTSPMNSEHDDMDGPALEWDPSGTDFETNENISDDTAGQTVSADGLYRPTGLDRNSISETESLLDTDFAEDDLVSGPHYDEPVRPPPQQFQDMLAKAEPSDDYIPHSAISKRFSDYIPAAVFESCLDMEDRNEKPSAHPAIPPPMPALDGYTSFAKKREPGRRFISQEILSVDRDGNGQEEDELSEPETTSLLNGGSPLKIASTVRPSHAWATELNGESRPFSSLLGKQTQV
ncbi:Fat-like cadherin-related tumor suppressor-like protein [Hypsibius exemplaris]|uniref:Fat-like cadherin-related tumor suppressor-like protein n=1 Tax=Hypsibius exemplaris TaxID=2072580 RepID=A0A9X6RJ92_HYPEX|nr:Fat-like cadherin-related tumor suppressor-like protein [Hypsibius exemplaris]